MVSRVFILKDRLILVVLLPFQDLAILESQKLLLGGLFVFKLIRIIYNGRYLTAVIILEFLELLIDLSILSLEDVGSFGHT